MMMNAKKKSVIFLLGLIFSLVLSGCESKVEGYTIDESGIYRNDAPSAVVVIVGNHANMMSIPEDAYKAVDGMLDQVVYGGYMCAIVDDSTPTKTEIVDADFFAEDARNSEILNSRISTRKAELIDYLKQVAPADSQEVDLLQAINEAKTALSTPEIEGFAKKQIVIIDSGVSTAGYVDFTTFELLSGKPIIKNFISQLDSVEGYGVLPDLSGISVTFVGTSDGLAEAAFPQELSTTDKKYIKELWSSIITACGAKDIYYVSAAGWDTPNVYTEDAESTYQYVTAVPFYHEDIFDYSKLPNSDPGDPDSQPDMPPPPELNVGLKSEVIGFKGDSADFKNENVVNQLLKPYANDLNAYFAAYPDEIVWLVGTSATIRPNGEGDIDLSLRRAEAVKGVLVEFGVPADKLVTIGLGAIFPWHVDEFSGGYFNTNVAQENRAVWILGSSDKKRNLLKAAYEKNELLSQAMDRLSDYLDE